MRSGGQIVLGGIKLLVELVQRLKAREVVVVAGGAMVTRCRQSGIRAAGLLPGEDHYAPGPVQGCKGMAARRGDDSRRASGNRRGPGTAAHGANPAADGKAGGGMSFQGLTLQWEPLGGNGMATVAAEVHGDQVAEQIFNPGDAAACEEFAALVCEGHPGIDRLTVKNELAKVAAEMKRLPRFKPFPTAVLPEVVAAFIRAAAKALGCDESYIALPLFIALASAVGNSRRIRIKRTWCEPAIVWAVIVAESGTVKSPAHELAMTPIHRLQDAALRDYRDAVKRFPAAWANYEADMAEWKRAGRKKGEPPPEEPAEPVAVRVL